MKTSSVLNTPEMAAVKNQLAPQEAGLLDGALAELRRQRELERMMSERAAEAQRQQALIQAARDAEREMIQQLAQEAAMQRRAEHELSVATADQDDLSNEAHRAIGALPKQSQKGDHMSRNRTHLSSNSENDRKDLEALVADVFDKESQVRDAALVGYSAPGMGDREVYLESRAPDAAARSSRALMGGGAGLALGSLGGAAATLLGRGRGATRNALMGALGGGSLGALAGALNPMSVRTAYDPDYGTQLSEREERRAAAVHRALQAGSQPSNIAMQQPGTQIAARPFGGQAPTFSYAADIDDMIREDPAMAQALLGKTSEAPKKTEAYDNAPGLKGKQKTELPDNLQKAIVKKKMSPQQAADLNVAKARYQSRAAKAQLKSAKAARRAKNRLVRDLGRANRRYKSSSIYGIDRTALGPDNTTLRLVTGTADHPRAAERAALQRSADTNLTNAQVHAFLDALTDSHSGYSGVASAQAQRDLALINAIDSYSPKGSLTSTRSRTPEEYAQAVQELYEANRSANTAGGATLGGLLGGLGGMAAGALRTSPRAGLGGLLGLGGGAALGGVLGRIATNKSPAADKTVTTTLYRGLPEDAIRYAEENYPVLKGSSDEADAFRSATTRAISGRNEAVRAGRAAGNQEGRAFAAATRDVGRVLRTPSTAGRTASNASSTASAKTKKSGYSSATRTRGGVKSAYEKAKRDAKKEGAERKNTPHGHRREES